MNIAKSEWQVMRILWSTPGLSSNQIFDYISNDKKLTGKKTTVKTLLSRLLNKKILHVVVRGRTYFYYPTISEEEALGGITNEFSEGICALQLPKAILQLIERTKLSNKNIEELEHCLKEKKQSAEIEITCNCL